MPEGNGGGDSRTLGEAFRLIADTRDLCAQRAQGHVSLDLYRSERDALRRDLAEIQQENTRLWEKLSNYAKEQRQWRGRMVIAVLTAFIGPVLTTVFLFILLEVGPA